MYAVNKVNNECMNMNITNSFKSICYQMSIIIIIDVSLQDIV